MVFVFVTYAITTQNITITFTYYYYDISIRDLFKKCDQIRSFLNGKLHFLCNVFKLITVKLWSDF